MSKDKTLATVPSAPPQELVKVGILTSYESLPMSDSLPPVCTWQLTTVEGKAKLHQLIAGKSLVIWDECERGPVDIVISDLAASFGSWEPEDRPGELIEGPIFYLVGPGQAYHTGSALVYRAMQQLALIYGPPPWHPPVILRCERVPTRNRKMRLAVTLVGEAQGQREKVGD